LKIKPLVKRNLRLLAFEIRRTGPGRLPDLTDFLAARDVDVVLDVGAHVGWFGQRLRECGYRGTIVSFEPIGAAFSQLQALAAHDGNWQAHQLALGATAGRTLINVSEKLDFSSILTQSSAAHRFEQQPRLCVRKRSRLRGWTPSLAHTVTVGCF
jgi:hypothetical protein